MEGKRSLIGQVYLTIAPPRETGEYEERKEVVMRFGMVLAVVLTVTTIPLGVEKTPPMNGFWWDETPAIAKTGFVIGYVAGIDHANKLLVEALAAHKNSLTSAQTGTPLESYMNFYDIRFGQLRDGLTEFYKDSQNKRININLATLYVRDEIRGMSQGESKLRVEIMRKKRQSKVTMI